MMPFKFSKDKFWLEPPTEKLRKQLEEELKLSGTNLKSHAWYHGRIPWEVCLTHTCTHTHTQTHAHTNLTILPCENLCFVPKCAASAHAPML